MASRLSQAVLMLLSLTALVFVLGRASGSPVYLLLPADASPEAVVALEERLGLNEPLPKQYLVFMTNVATGDFGNSLVTKSSVVDSIASRAVASLQLSVLGIAIVFCGIPLGMLAALKRGRWIDFLIRFAASMLQAVPYFWLGVMLSLVFGARLGWFPVSGRSGWQSAILPSVALAAFPLAAITRLMRASVLRVLSEEYILVARAKGLAERTIIWKHVLRNSVIPVASLASVLVILYFLTGSVVIERVFAWPGLGYLAYTSAFSRDFPILQGLTLLFGIVFIAGSFLVDILIRVLDPRTRTSRTGV